jgi:membrane fusion protein, heavy metal efflux system
MMKHLILTSFFASLVFSTPTFAHAGHEEAPGSDGSIVSDTVILSETAIKNLGIETAKAELSPQARTISMNAVAELLPEKQALITPRAPGRVTELYVKVGDPVRSGQELLALQPVNIGSGDVVLTAPIDGTVMRQNVVLGQPVTTDTVVMEVGDPSQMLVRGTLFETPDVVEVKVGQPARVSGRLLRHEELGGAVQRVDSGFEKESRTLSVYALVDNPERALLANMQVKLAVLVDEPTDVLTVPTKAILGETGENFLFVRNGNVFERRSVSLGAIFGDRHEVLEGVFPDEEVVTVGNYQLQFAKSSSPLKTAGNRKE